MFFFFHQFLPEGVFSPSFPSHLRGVFSFWFFFFFFWWFFGLSTSFPVRFFKPFEHVLLHGVLHSFFFDLSRFSLLYSCPPFGVPSFELPRFQLLFNLSFRGEVLIWGHLFLSCLSLPVFLQVTLFFFFPSPDFSSMRFVSPSWFGPHSVVPPHVRFSPIFDPVFFFLSGLVLFSDAPGPLSSTSF